MKYLHDNKLNKGFGLIEVMIALAMMGLVLSAIFALQNATLSRREKTSSKLYHAIPLQTMLYELIIEPLLPDQKTIEKIHEEPAMKMIYARDLIVKDHVDGLFSVHVSDNESKKMPSFKTIEGLYRETIKGSWKKQKGLGENLLVRFTYKHKNEDKEGGKGL